MSQIKQSPCTFQLQLESCLASKNTHKIGNFLLISNCEKVLCSSKQGDIYHIENTFNSFPKPCNIALRRPKKLSWKKYFLLKGEKIVTQFAKFLLPDASFN